MRGLGCDGTHCREGVTSAAAARGISMLVVVAAVRPAAICTETGLLSFWALQQQEGGSTPGWLVGVGWGRTRAEPAYAMSCVSHNCSDLPLK